MKKLFKGLAFAACLAFLIPGLAEAYVLDIGPTFTRINSIKNGIATVEGGGSIEVSYLNGVEFDYLYCIDLFRTVYVPGTYPNTVVTNDGTIYGIPVNNAGKVAWLLSQYGTGGQGDEAYALQAAIWHVVNDGTGNTYTIDRSRSSDSQEYLYDLYLSELDSNTENAAKFLWITPGRLDSSGHLVEYQGLVGITVPEPTALILLGCGLVGVAGFRRTFGK